MPPFVQPKFSVIKRFGDRSREIYYNSKGKFWKLGLSKTVALSEVANETRGIIKRFYCTLLPHYKSIFHETLFDNSTGVKNHSVNVIPIYEVHIANTTKYFKWKFLLPPHICLGFDKVEPDYLTVWQHLDDLYLAPENGNDIILFYGKHFNQCLTTGNSMSRSIS